MANFLIVDDSKTGRHITRDKVTLLGHTVIGEAEDGFEAISKYRALNPDFVIMDVNMPKLDGISAAKNITKEFPSAKIFILTSDSEMATRTSAVANGATEFLVKPLNMDELKDKINRNLK